ncbi:Vascular endothelial growth factor A [Scale drop disease virus]|uniref:ORF_011R n=1 Tax=Scale drop disease virus TaxID=1697349 RepID=A0A0K1L638_9VIRU|nr:ORF_011R [Scale drop disease virus]AKU37426.1 ORF_011R [Scale drop disease virus]QLI60681.1 Vascular endothelial growth factor A [Scale drop disease virus]QXJ13599.1 ORF011R [Scale drop disease virus]UNH60774.1 Vascular endothelial growth factor A [Scale drop disease virus]
MKPFYILLLCTSIVYAIEPDISKIFENSQCKPRSTKINVYSLAGSDVSIMYKPACIYVDKCGGCCNDEALACKPIEKTTVNVTVLSIGNRNAQFQQFPVVTHTKCNCLPKPSRRGPR